MQNKEWALQDAKNKFSEVVNAASTGDPQIVTRRGVPAAVVLSIDDFCQYKKLLSLNLPSFTEHLLNIPVDDGEFERLDISPRDIW